MYIHNRIVSVSSQNFNLFVIRCCLRIPWDMCELMTRELVPLLWHHANCKNLSLHKKCCVNNLVFKIFIYFFLDVNTLNWNSFSFFYFYPLYKLINLLSDEFVDVCIYSNSRKIQLIFFIYWWNMHLKSQQEQVKSWRQLKLNAGEEIEDFYP